MTPVTETYNHIGNVHRAIRRCRSKSSFQARQRVTRAIGTIVAASITCEIKIEKYTGRTHPEPEKGFEPTCQW